MKRNYFVGQLVLLVLIGMLAGCKKDSIAANEETLVSEKGIANLKSWYNGKGNVDAMVTANQNTPNIGTLDWDATIYNRSSNAYITPIINLAQKKGFTYLVAYADNDGSIQSGKHVFIFVNSAETKLLLSSKINAGFIEGSLVPNDFSGVIIDQDLQNKYISSKHFENGKVNATKKDDVVYKSKTKVYEQLKNNIEPDPNVAPDPSCIDWYWQTWIDGVLVNEEYQFTTCNAGGGGGGGGISNGSVGSCNNLALSLNNITHSRLAITDYSIGTPITMANGKIRVPASPIGTIEIYNFPFGYSPTFTSFFSAVKYKNNASDPLWKWESFTFNSFGKFGGVLPPNVASTPSGQASIVISTDKQTASSTGNYSITFVLNCGPLNINLPTKSGTINENWNAENGLSAKNNNP